MKQFRTFILKETRHILRDRRTMLILFGMPVVMTLLLGFAIRTDVRNVRTIAVTASNDHLTRQILQRLDASEYFTLTATASTPAEAEQMLRAQRAEMAIVFCGDFASHRLDTAAIQLMVDAADPNMAQQYATYAQGIIAASAGAAAPVSTRMLYNPQMLSAYNFVPGIMGMVILLICAMMTSSSIVREKERGTMEVLLVSPVRPLMIIVAKAVPYMVLGVGILITILLMSRYVLAVPMSGPLWAIFSLSLLYILMALALGLLISNLARTQLAAFLVSAVVLLMPTLMLSGMMFPVESMPAILQWVAHVVPATYYIAAMRKLMIMGVGAEHVAWEAAMLAAITALLLTLALLTFKKRLQ